MNASFSARISGALVLLALVLSTSGCLKSPDEKYAAYMESGKAYMEKAEYGAALIEFKNAARVKSTEAEPFYQMALCNQERGQLQDAADAVQAAVKLDPNHAGANLLLARLMVQTGKPENLSQAEALINTVLADERGNSEALFVLAATRARLGSPQDAAQLLEEALRNSPEHLESAMSLARLKLTDGDVAGAEAVLKKAVADAKDKKDAKIALGQFYLGQGRDDDGRAQFEEILAEDPAHGPALLGLGMLHVKNGEKEKAEEVYKRASRVKGELYQPLYGQILMYNGKQDEAVTEFERLAEENPKDRAARTRLVAALLQTKREAEAEKVLTAALAEQPNDTDARLQRAELHRRAGRLQQAQEDVAAALEYRPDSPQAHYQMAQIYEELGDSRLQRQELDEALRINPDFLAARLELAQAMLKGAGATPQSALDLLNETPADQRDTTPVVAARIWAHIALKRNAEARRELERIPAEARANHPEFLLQAGMLESLEGKYAAARPLFEKALERNPSDIRALNALAATYEAEKKMALALQTVKQHIDKYPDDPRLQIALGTWYARANYVNEAEQAYKAAIKAGDPTHEAAMMLARIYSATKQLDKAEALLTETLEKAPGNPALLIVRATIRDGLGKATEAIADYRKVVERNPEHYVALNNLAYLLATHENSLEEALKYAQQAKEFAPTVAQAGQPSVAEIDDTLGWVYYLRGVYASAVVHLRASADANPRNPITQYHLAMAHAKNGDIAAGRKALDAGLQLNPNLPEAAEAKKVLGSAN